MSGEDIDDIYADLLRNILKNGEKQSNSRGDNKAMIGVKISVDARKIPMITRRALKYKQSNVELLWWLKGEDNIDYLKKHHCYYWNKDADEDGFVGLNYGLMTNWPCKAEHKSEQISCMIVLRYWRILIKPAAEILMYQWLNLMKKQKFQHVLSDIHST